ncbi:putative Long-chain acyl-[acyl-carrier-protein] reductase [Nitrospira tepida]|uniref:Long-chain acyl-[acyl-carrier-protein] reductase n=2 Tax=Nitrospira tepida TaxID=2973512 RepID=A0AA86MXV8_9BACT|nr:putative Long-chain acyl-[acyl-carrier-protein] reductase [Nitrospira tepida]
MTVQQGLRSPINSNHHGVLGKPSDSHVSISLPVVVDFHGTLSRGVTEYLGLDSLSFVCPHAPSKGSVMSVYICFGRATAYMHLSGRVAEVNRCEISETTRYTISLHLNPLSETEQSVLQSCLHEIDAYLTGLTRQKSAHQHRRNGDPPAERTNPRSILSLFVTDNPYTLPYRLKSQNLFSTLSHMGSQAVRLMTTVSLRKSAPMPSASLSHRTLLWLRSIPLFIQLVRDLMVRFLPRCASRFLVQPVDFVFIGHPRDLTDVPRKFPFAKLMPPAIVERWFRHQWPFVASYITGLKAKSGRLLKGAMLISPLTTEQMIRNPRAARQRVLETVRLAERMGARIAGLGAFTSIVTRDGKDLLDKVHLGLTTGNPHSAAIAVQNVLEAAALTNLSVPHATVAIVGGAGSVGSACAKLLGPLSAHLVLIDIKRDELAALVSLLKRQSISVEGTGAIARVAEADIVIAATNSPHALIDPDILKPGAIVIDAAQPKNVSEQVSHQRPDVLVIESAIVQTPGVEVNFDLGLESGEALGCLSETMILAAIGWEGHYSIGKADPLHGSHILAAARELGFRLARFRNSTGPITEEDLVRIARARIGALTGV